MQEVDQTEIDAAIGKITAAQQELPEAGKFNACISSLKEILGLLKEVWDTDGGQHSTEKLEECINDLEGLSGIESFVSVAKSIKPEAEPTGPFILY
ncbi:MAG: hypothetical protein PUD25_04420 [Bacilli bacterium]|nr:hypothetical protein [Bacilli bacterium]